MAQPGCVGVDVFYIVRNLPWIPWKTTSAPCDGRVDPSTEASASLQRRVHKNVRHKRYGMYAVAIGYV